MFVPPVSQTLLALCLLPALAMLLTWSFTTARYYRQISSLRKQSVAEPAQIPYAIPWLGHAIAFLLSPPGSYWDRLFAWHSRSTGICTLLIAGTKTHIIYSKTAAQVLLRHHLAVREDFDTKISTNILDMGVEDVERTETGRHDDTALNRKYLMGPDSVVELTARFAANLEKYLLDDDLKAERSQPVALYYGWLRDRMFRATCHSFLGSRLLEGYPLLAEDIWSFDAAVPRFFFRLPWFMMPDAARRRHRMFREFAQWRRDMRRESGGYIADIEDGPDWEPKFGSRFIRARQLGYDSVGLSDRGAAASDAIITFALVSNPYPAAAWMLFNILSPDCPADLLPRVLSAIGTSRYSDGTLDIRRLIANPLLSSIWTEVLRMYIDVLVARNLVSDVVVPLDPDGTRSALLRAGSHLFVPSWISHHDAADWTADNARPAMQFDAERFLTRDPETGQETFKPWSAGGAFVPFGGGAHMCPGRVLAKHKALTTLAVLLTHYSFEVKGFTDAGERLSPSMPTPKATSLPGSGVHPPDGDILVVPTRRKP
jgi:hypothetical protein